MYDDVTRCMMMWHDVWWCDTMYDDVTRCMMMWHYKHQANIHTCKITMITCLCVCLCVWCVCVFYEQEFGRVFFVRVCVFFVCVCVCVCVLWAGVWQSFAVQDNDDKMCVCVRACVCVCVYEQEFGACQRGASMHILLHTGASIYIHNIFTYLSFDRNFLSHCLSGTCAYAGSSSGHMFMYLYIYRSLGLGHMGGSSGVANVLLMCC